MSGELELKFDPVSEKKFHAALEKFYKTEQEGFKSILTRIKVMTLNHIKARSYSSRSGSSIGIGPGREYGHVRDSLQGRSNAIGWGGYVRINFRAGGKGFVARFHEFGTGAMGRMPNRYSKSGRFYFAAGTGPGQGKNLPARAPMAAGYASMDQTMIERGLSEAIDKVLK